MFLPASRIRSGEDGLPVIIIILCTLTGKGKLMELISRYKKGLTDMLILKLLTEGDDYPYQLAQRIRECSDGKIVIKEFALYPILYRMEEKGFLTSYGQKHGRMERVYFHVQEAGREELKELVQAYEEVKRGIEKILYEPIGEEKVIREA